MDQNSAVESKKLSSVELSKVSNEILVNIIKVLKEAYHDCGLCLMDAVQKNLDYENNLTQLKDQLEFSKGELELEKQAKMNFELENCKLREELRQEKLISEKFRKSVVNDHEYTCSTSNEENPPENLTIFKNIRKKLEFSVAKIEKINYIPVKSIENLNFDENFEEFDQNLTNFNDFPKETPKNSNFEEIVEESDQNLTDFTEISEEVVVNSNLDENFERIQENFTNFNEISTQTTENSNFEEKYAKLNQNFLNLQLDYNRNKRILQNYMGLEKAWNIERQNFQQSLTNLNEKLAILENKNQFLIKNLEKLNADFQNCKVEYKNLDENFKNSTEIYENVRKNRNFLQNSVKNLQNIVQKTNSDRIKSKIEQKKCLERIKNENLCLLKSDLCKLRSNFQQFSTEIRLLLEFSATNFQQFQKNIDNKLNFSFDQNKAKNTFDRILPNLTQIIEKVTILKEQNEKSIKNQSIIQATFNTSQSNLTKNQSINSIPNDDVIVYNEKINLMSREIDYYRQETIDKQKMAHFLKSKIVELENDKVLLMNEISMTKNKLRLDEHRLAAIIRR